MFLTVALFELPALRRAWYMIKSRSLRLYPYHDKTRDTRLNITSWPREFPGAKPGGSLESKRLYLTVCPESSHYRDSGTFLTFIMIIKPSAASLSSEQKSLRRSIPIG